MSSKKYMKEHLRLSEAARILGVTAQTLRAWDKDGHIRIVRSAGKHRLVPREEVDRFLGTKGADRTVTLVYARCSTQKQTENLERQVGRLLEHCAMNRWQAELYKDIGSGLNDNRKAFRQMLKRLGCSDVKRVLIEYKDRACRYGFSLFEEYCATLGVEVAIMATEEPKDFEQELAEDMVALVASFSARLYGRRGGRKKHANTQP